MDGGLVIFQTLRSAKKLFRKFRGRATYSHLEISPVGLFGFPSLEYREVFIANVFWRHIDLDLLSIESSREQMSCEREFEQKSSMMWRAWLQPWGHSDGSARVDMFKLLERWIVLIVLLVLDLQTSWIWVAPHLIRLLHLSKTSGHPSHGLKLLRCPASTKRISGRSITKNHKTLDGGVEFLSKIVGDCGTSTLSGHWASRAVRFAILRARESTHSWDSCKVCMHLQ